MGSFIILYLMIFPLFFAACYIPQMVHCAFCRGYHSCEDMMPLN